MMELLLIFMQASPIEATRAPCELRQDKMGDKAAMVVRCGTGDVMIAPAKQYNTARNLGTGAVAVVAQNDEGTRVFIVRSDPEGRTLSEELTDLLTSHAGRRYDEGLRGLEVDLTRFAGTGVIGVSNGNGGGWIAQFDAAAILKVDIERRAAISRDR